MSILDRKQSRVRVKEPEPKVAQKPVYREHVGAFSINKDIKEMPVPKGVGQEIICGTPIDWHDLENFVEKISPNTFVNLLKLEKQMIRDKLWRKFSGQGYKKPLPWGIIIIMIIIVVAGIGIVMFAPQLTEMMKGAMPI